MSYINREEDNIKNLISEVETTCPRTYKSGWEHLADELLKLDTLIHLKILTTRKCQQNKKLDEFAGLLITEEEIDNLLCMQSRNDEKLTSLAKDSKFNALLNNIERLRTKISEKIEESIKFGIHLPLHTLSYLFHLSPFELNTVLICLAPELDLKYEKLYAYLQDDVTKKQPSVNLILDMFFTANNSSAIPGDLVLQDDQNTSDAVAQSAHDKAETVYEYYNDTFGRDSYDDNGATLISTVHFRQNYNNAYWSNYYEQLVYGDGDGVRWKPMALALDIVAHELTHAVTSRTARFVYAEEAGAMVIAWLSAFQLVFLCWLMERSGK